MNKLYTLPKPQNIPSPKKETLQFITQFSAAYIPFSGATGQVDFIAN